MPVFFNIIDNMYKYKDNCIRIPYEIRGVNGTLEFMTIGEIKETEKYSAEALFKHCGYKLDDSVESLNDIDTFVKYMITKSYQSEFSDEERKFFDKYPELFEIFKPESYEYFDVGFVTDSFE